MTISNKNISISLNFMPSFYHKHLGVKYGDAFYFDPRYRAEVETAEGVFLYEILGHVGVGSKIPAPSANLFIQPIDLLKATQGADIVCPTDATLETRGHTWSNYTVDEIEHLDPRAAANHPFIDTILGQYREMVKLYGERADIFGMKSGLMNIHAPYTTAHQLFGEEIFYLMSDDPKDALVVFNKIWEMYQAIFTRIRTEIGAPPANRIYMGDCSASMLSAEQYREVVLPANQAIAAQFSNAGYHSCGPSTHLLDDFATIPSLTTIELGAGTDLTKAVKSLPGVNMYPLVDPLAMRNESTNSIAAITRAMAAECSPAPSTMLCAWSLDSETPIENVAAMYAAVNDIKKS
jgi:uroporphyrinogen-III decarboxylase